MDARVSKMMAIAITTIATLAGCEKPKAAQWMQITQGDPCAAAAAAAPAATCDAGAFSLDTANLSVKAGTPYIILQTRYADGRIGSIRAEVNCPRQIVEPTALKEAVYGKDGALASNRMTQLSADDERALLKYACAKL